MRPIQMVDLQVQYQKIKPEVDAAIQQVIDSAAFINGPQVKSFADKLGDYLGGAHVIPCANGTDALQIAIMALELPAGSEIIVPSFNYVATAEVIALLGHKPVFCEVDPETFTMEVKSVKKLITDKTAAIMPVHLFGQCAHMEPLLELATERDLFVIEDNAQAIGAIYTSQSGETSQAGTMGHVGTTSFFPSKNLGCYGDGGAIYTTDEELAQELRVIANHGQRQKYHYQSIGVNSRLDTLQAALLEVKLTRLDDYKLARQEVASFYDNALLDCPGLTLPHRASWSSHVFHQYTLQIKPELRDGLKEYLQQQQIPSMVYYPVPLHLQEAYSYLGYKQGDFQVTERLCESVLSLPIHTEMDTEQLAYISQHVRHYLEKHSA